MGLSEDEAYASLRFSFGVLNTAAEIEAAAEAIRDHAARLRAFAAQLRIPCQAARS